MSEGVCDTNGCCCAQDAANKRPYEPLVLAAPPHWAPRTAIPEFYAVVAVPGQHSRKPHLGRLLAPFLPAEPRCLEARPGAFCSPPNTPQLVCRSADGRPGVLRSCLLASSPGAGRARATRRWRSRAWTCLKSDRRMCWQILASAVTGLSRHTAARSGGCPAGECATGKSIPQSKGEHARTSHQTASRQNEQDTAGATKSPRKGRAPGASRSEGGQAGARSGRQHSQAAATRLALTAATCQPPRHLA